jgi:hypothetical protein
MDKNSLFDDLARSLAGPIPRRRACAQILRGLGVAALASVGLSRTAHAAGCPHGQFKCGKNCCPNADDCCGSTTCCAKGQTCCGKSCCAKGSSCCSGTTCCPKGQVCCGTTCCAKGQTCDHGTCKKDSTAHATATIGV